VTAVLELLVLVGWRGAIAAAVGGVVAGLAAFPAGRFVERAVCHERVDRVVAEHELTRMELHNARIDAALAARVRADRDGREPGGSGLPDDGFRRD